MVVWLAVFNAVACGGLWSAVHVTHVSSETAAIEGRASPRKRRVVMLRSLAAVRSFEVACLEKGVSTWWPGMPVPLSWTLMDLAPPCSMDTVICVAPASMAFSTSSLTTEAGRSTTSPAAICAATVGGST